MECKINKGLDGRQLGPGKIELEQDDKCQRVGVTTDLLIELLETYKKLGYDQLTLFVETDNPILICPVLLPEEVDKEVIGLLLSPVLANDMKK